MNYVESYPSVVSKPIQKWTLTEIGKNSTVTTTSLRERMSDSCSKCTKGGAISVEICVTTRRLSPPIDDEEEDRTSLQLRNDCDWRWPEGLAPLLNLDAHLSLRNWELKPGHVAPLRLVGTHLSVRHWALEGNQVPLISNATDTTTQLRLGLAIDTCFLMSARSTLSGSAPFDHDASDCHRAWSPSAATLHFSAAT